MGITCQILHPSGFGRWRSPTSSLDARLVDPGYPPLIRALEADSDGALPELLPEESDHPALWLGNEFNGIRLAPSIQLGDWTQAVHEEARVLVATTPDDLHGALLVFELENESELSGGWGLFGEDLADLLAAADSALMDLEFSPSERRLAFAITCARARAEASYASERARRLEKRAEVLAAKNYLVMGEAL
jgi:hypothetical protein